MTEPSCYICKRETRFALTDEPDVTLVPCVRCGHYRISGSSIRELGNERPGNWWAISYRLRQAHEQRSQPKIDTSSWRKHWRDSLVTMTVDQRLDTLLRLIEQHADRLDANVEISLWDYCGRVPAVDDNELLAMLRHLNKIGLITEPKHSDRGSAASVSLTMKGWQHLQQHPGRHDTVFVAMSFNSKMDPAYEAITAAIGDCNLKGTGSRQIKGHRVDKEVFTHEITEEIVTGLLRSWVVVADVTLRSSGAYFEAGYAMALGRPVIFTCKRRTTWRKDVHFDTQQYPHILWTDEDHLRVELARRLEHLVTRRQP